MADNVNLTPGSGVVIASEDIGGGVQHQLVKLEFGTHGTATLVTAAAPLPVVDSQLHADLVSLLARFAASATVASSGVAKSLAIKGTAGTLRLLTVYNSAATDYTLQLFDAATLPGDTTVPTLLYPLPALSTVVIDLGFYGIPFTTGIQACASSTVLAKTLIATNDCLFNAQFV
jgi:hypothetical protein